MRLALSDFDTELISLQSPLTCRGISVLFYGIFIFGRLERILTMMYIVQNSQNFFGLFHRPVFQKTRRFRNWICFRPQVKVGEKTPTQLSPLERANLSLSLSPMIESSSL
jgi:hypothetical protein